MLLHHVLELIASEKDTFMALINAVPDQEFSSKLFSLHAVKSILTAKLPSHYTERQKEYMYLFICQGGYAISRKWLNEAVQDSPDMIAELIYDLAMRVLV